MINIYFLILFLVLEISKRIYSQRNLIYIPFHLQKLKYNSNYNSSNFLNDYFERAIILHLKIGTPFQNVNTFLDQASECFIAKEDKSINNINNNYYFPNKSSSIGKRSGMIIDQINFEEKNESNIVQIKIDKYKIEANSSYILKIGLLIPYLFPDQSCPSFFYDLKKNKIINKYIWTIKYNNNDEGNFIVGENLTEYDPINYPIINYYTIYMNLKFFIYFDSVYIESKSKIKYNLNSTNIFISINSGFIIGPKEYKNYIDKIFFNDLIEKNICNMDEINYIFHNNTKQAVEYYVYSCYEELFKNYYNYFPNLVFSKKDLEYNFEFTNKDLFIHINDKFYFLIIFLKTTNKKEEIWYFGEPFYKKYTFSMDIDAKALGFYIDKNKILEKDDINNKDNKNKENNGSNYFKIIILIAELAILIGLIIIACILALKIKERKKRLNEIKDDNYEYITEDYSNIN